MLFGIVIFQQTLYLRFGTMTQLVSMDTVNELGYESFVSMFGNVVERCPVIAAAVWSLRPFPNIHKLHQALCMVIDGFSTQGMNIYNKKCYKVVRQRTLLYYREKVPINQ